MDTETKGTDWLARAEVMRAEERLRLQAVCPQALGGEMGNVLRTDLALVLGDYHAMLARAEAAEAKLAVVSEERDRAWESYSDMKAYREAAEAAEAREANLRKALDMVLVQYGPYRDGDGAAKFHAVNIAREALGYSSGDP